MTRVYCCDVGGPSSLGWARMSIADLGRPDVEGGRSMRGLVTAITADLEADVPVALGFECPLFMPIPSEATLLSCGREHEGNRSMFAPAGGYVALLGLHLAAWSLSQLRRPGVGICLDAGNWSCQGTASILIWEAFVSGPAHTRDGDHRRDAATAVIEFARRYGMGPPFASDVSLRANCASLSLAACAALWAGLSADLALLRSSVFVVRPMTAYAGAIREIDPV